MAVLKLSDPHEDAVIRAPRESENGRDRVSAIAPT